MTENLFKRITEAVRAYGSTLAPNPVMKVQYTVVPSTSDIGDDGYHLAVQLECLGEITDGEPKPLGNVLWTTDQTSLPLCLEDILTQVQVMLRQRAIEMQACLNGIVPLLPIVATPTSGRVVEVEAVLRPAR